MIVVTGASGQLGRRIVEQLIERTSVDGVGATCREPAQAAPLAARGVRVRQADYGDPASLRHGLEGARRVLLVSSNAAAYGGDPLTQHHHVIEICRELGVERLFYTSHMAASPTSAFVPMHTHAATEAMLADSGLSWTALRNGFYASSALDFLGDAPKSGLVETPADGPVNWTAHDDLAEAAARLLLGDDAIDGPTAPLVGATALDLDALAALVAQLTGRPCRRVVQSDDIVRERMVQRGIPASFADFLLGYYVASRNGEFASEDDTLSRILGRAPIPLRAVLAPALDALN